MEERVLEKIRLLPRGDLEAFAFRAAVHVRESRRETDSSHFFSAVLMGFMLGVLVASAAFLVGSSLG